MKVFVDLIHLIIDAVILAASPISSRKKGCACGVEIWRIQALVPAQTSPCQHGRSTRTRILAVEHHENILTQHISKYLHPHSALASPADGPKRRHTPPVLVLPLCWWQYCVPQRTKAETNALEHRPVEVGERRAARAKVTTFVGANLAASRMGGSAQALARDVGVRDQGHERAGTRDRARLTWKRDLGSTRGHRRRETGRALH